MAKRATNLLPARPFLYLVKQTKVSCQYARKEKKHFKKKFAQENDMDTQSSAKFFSRTTHKLIQPNKTQPDLKIFFSKAFSAILSKELLVFC